MGVFISLTGVGIRLLRGRVARCTVTLFFALFSAVAWGQGQLEPPPRSDVPAMSANLIEARRLVDAGKFALAAALLTQSVQAGDHSAAVHRLLGLCDLRLNRPAESLGEYTLSAAIEHPSSGDLQNVAKDYILLGDTASAERWMQAAVDMDDRDPEAWYGLGRVRYTQQRFQAAAECFQSALVLSPRSVKVENNLGLTYEALGRMNDAVLAYRQAIGWQEKAEHPSEQPLLNLAIVLFHRGELTETEELLQKAVEIAPKDAKVREELGQLYLKRKLPVQAEEHLRVAIALQPKQAALHFLLGKSFHMAGDEAEAKREFALAAGLSGERSTPDHY